MKTRDVAKKQSDAPKPLTLREQLRVIEGFLTAPGGNKLADVLAGLRGPDNKSRDAKNASTTFIRTNAFPRLSRKRYISGSAHDHWMFAGETHPEQPIDLAQIQVYSDSAHFTDHVRRAAKVLGIKYTGGKE